MSISSRRGLFRNWPLKLAALFLSLTLYVAVAAQEQETQDFAMRIEVRIPPGRTLLSDPPNVRVTLRGKGGELLKLRLFRQVISLRVPDTLSTATWFTTLQPADIELPKGADLQVADIAPREIAIQLDPVASKEVRIVARVQVLPESGQALDGGLQITPNMARIVGPDRQVAAIDSVTTLPTELDGVHGSFTRFVALDTAPLGVVRLAPKEVRVTGTTATVYERVFNLLPIESGAGPLTGYELQPARTAVTVRGPEALVQALTKDSLKVIVHLTGPVADSATVHLMVVAPRGVEAHAAPDSVLIVRRRSGRG
jgi:YbbR domain-containing protein